MKKKLLWTMAALILALPAAGASAAPRGHFGRGGGRIVVRGYVGPYWGWGWGWGYYGYPYEYAAYGASSTWGAVKTDVEPEDARVYLDGQYIGVADDFDGWPGKLYLRPGHYRLEFRLHGYEPVTINVDAKAGTTLEVDNRLRKAAPGMATQADPPKMTGNVPRFFGKRRDGDTARAYLPDQDRSSVSAGGDDGPPPMDADADRDDGRDRAPAVAPDNSWGHNEGRSASSSSSSSSSARSARGSRSRLTIHAEPADAAVYVDDRFVGTADELASMDRGIVVKPGKHTVTVSRPGFKDQSSDVDVDAGRSQTVEIELEH
jgi:hypothetical protein